MQECDAASIYFCVPILCSVQFNKCLKNNMDNWLLMVTYNAVTIFKISAHLFIPFLYFTSKFNAFKTVVGSHLVVMSDHTYVSIAYLKLRCSEFEGEKASPCMFHVNLVLYSL